MRKITKANLKELMGLNTDCPWEEVNVELCRSASGVVRVYLRGQATPFHADGEGYCKESVVLGEFINDWVGEKVTNNYGEGITALRADLINASKSDTHYSLSHGIKTKSGTLYKLSLKRI
jgi:hypothetical protein